jgi:ribosomal-protein-alanine N-acetyltransferase
MNHLGTQRIETERLILRKFEATDAENMFKNWASDDQVTKYLTWPTHKSIETSRDVLKMWIEEYSKLNNYQWCIEYKENGEAIGSISIVHQNEDTLSAEIGYCIGREYWNKGITSEAMKAIINFLFNHVVFNRVEARHDPCNPNSGKVMEKCGLSYEGLRKKADKNNTGICDVALYGILREGVCDEVKL